MTLKTFAEIIQPTARDAVALTFTISDDWLQGRSSFGGLQAAFALAAMRQLTGVTAPLRVLQTTFIAPVGGGDVRVVAHTLRAGKSVTHVEARLMQGEDTACLVVGIFGAARESAIQVPMAARDAPNGPDGLRDLPFAKGIAPNFTQHFQWRWATGGWPYSGSREPFTRIWLKHKAPTGSTLFDAEIAFVALADAVPSPAISMMKVPKSSSSLTWSLELLRDTPPQADGFWRIDSDIHQAQQGYVAQTAVVVAPDNQPVALSRQAVVVFA
ncbi:MAG: thioesterase family protein [Pseudomonadota bacterium]